MLILLTNDDGIDAPGLAALEQAARQLGDVVVVAPATQCSQCGHRVSTHCRISVARVGAERFAVDGTPADCVRIALVALGIRPDVVLSGINAGGNLGADVYVSGTVAGAREAMLLGVHAIALSHYRRSEREYDWQRVPRWAVAVIRELLTRDRQPGLLWNVNFPHLDAHADDPPMVDCPLDPHALPVSFRTDGEAFRYNGDYHGRPRIPGGDIDVCFSGKIAVSALRPQG